MAVEFCDRCGNIMMPKKIGKTTYLVCRKCGNKKKRNIRVSKISEKTGEKKDILVLTDESQNLPKTKVVCPKCGNREAFWWLQQTRSVDEPPTQFFKCTKCGHTWREYK